MSEREGKTNGRKSGKNETVRRWNGGGIPRCREGERRGYVILKLHSYLFPQTSSFSNDCSTNFNEAPKSCSHAFEISEYFPITMILMVSLLDLKILSRYQNPTYQLAYSLQITDFSESIVQGWKIESDSDTDSPGVVMATCISLWKRFLRPHLDSDMAHVESVWSVGRGSRGRIARHSCPSLDRHRPCHHCN